MTVSSLFPLANTMQVYSDGISEFFILSQVYVPSDVTPIMRNEGALGRSFADLVHVDLNDILASVDFTTAETLDVSMRRVADCGGMALPLFAAMLDLQMALTFGGTVDFSEFEKQKKQLLALQHRLKVMIPSFLLGNQSEDLLFDYYLMSQQETEGIFTPLKFSNAELAISSTAAGYSFATLAITTLCPEECYNFLLYHLLKYNRQYRICKHCNRLFPVRPQSKIEYCDRPIGEEDKRCIDVGASRRYEKKTADIPAMREYQRSYKAHNARIRYGRMTREEFAAWAEEARAKRELCQAGELSLEDFVAWLDSDKMK